MGFFKRKKEEMIRSTEYVQSLISSVKQYGPYDGSANATVAAQQLFDAQKAYAGCANPHTSELYWETLRTSDLDMPLALAYACARGEYLEMPFYDPVASGGNTSTAHSNAEILGIAFPEYRSYVEARHSVDETRYILALSLNVLQH